MAIHSRPDLPLPLEQALTERRKELHCLQQIERIISTSQGTIDDILEAIVATIPGAWLYPAIAIAIARIRRGDRCYQTGDLGRCQSLQTSEIKIKDTV